MNSENSAASVYPDSKPHYEILDALRGVAALVVVIFHLFEPFSELDHTKQFINHGYLAVDFFFALSGFVIGHAYDDRWNTMTLGSFFKRRLIRLHPMIIVGMTFGALCFYFGDSPKVAPKIHDVQVGALFIVWVIGMTLLPVPKVLEIRGWDEMHPLDGPAWSLFFEYIANILYALVLRRLPTIVLGVLALIAAVATVDLAVYGVNGDVIGGWSTDPAQLKIGFTRLAYPFLAGLVLARVMKPGRIRPAFLLSSLLIVAVLAFPRVGGKEALWQNGIYDSVAIIALFPLIIWLGASGTVGGAKTRKVANFLGDISYPVYIIHYPLIYIYTGWVVDNLETLTKTRVALAMAAIFFGSVALAYASLKLYDIPVRRWLTKKFLTSE